MSEADRTEILVRPHQGNLPTIPAIVADAGERAGKRFVEFFTATIRDGNTRRAYARAVGDFFACCERHGLSLAAIEPVHVAAYIEILTDLGQSRSHRETAPCRYRHAVRLADKRRDHRLQPSRRVVWWSGPSGLSV